MECVQWLTVAVNALKSISANDDVGKAGTIRKDEDGVGAASILVRVAGLITVELLVAEVDASRDDTGLRERGDLADASGDVEGLRTSNAGNECRKLNLSELHVCCIKARKSGYSTKE